MTIKQLYRKISNALSESSCSDASFEARQIILTACSLDNTAFLLRENEDCGEHDERTAFQMLSRRLKGEPLQYILGKWDFMDNTFFVRQGVLIPRPETELLVETAIEILCDKPTAVVFDLCAGTGCVGLSIKKRFPHSQVYLFELSVDAIACLKKNISALGFSDSVTMIKGDVLQGLEAFKTLPMPDVIVSNPPYICSEEISFLQPEVLYEPKMALDGGKDGLDFYRAFSQKWLSKMSKGVIVVECGENQGNQVAEIFSLYCRHTQIKKDYSGHDRIVIGTI